MNKPVFRFGVDYYPEQWPESRWPEDARLMKQAGINVVRLAEFAWSKMEEQPGKFDFAWLDRILEILRSHGISAVLGTPSASPPPWLMTKYPDIFRVREDGRRVTYGNRCEFCPNNSTYLTFVQRIVAAMANHFASHPAVIGWQIDNELGERCYCPDCLSMFREWLHKYYGSLESLNAAWGTNFWSHGYTDWKEIPLPLSTGGSPNPGLALDYRRFISDSYLAYLQTQVDVLQAACPQHFITHNFMGFGYEGLDYFDLARNLDLVSWDNYPLGFWQKYFPVADPAALALGHDSMRGLKQKNFWVMEQQAGPSGWETVSPSSRPGQLRLWAYQAIAHGADGVVFFRWRTARFGTEQYWHGLLDHHGKPGRRYAEIRQMGTELHKIGESILGTSVMADVAILQSYDSRFAFQIQPGNPQFNYASHVTEIYQAIFGNNVSVDVVAPQSELSGYKLVIAPALHVLSEAIADNLKNYVHSGGTLVVTPRTGVKDGHNAVVNLPLPGLLSDVCGIKVDEYDSLFDPSLGGIPQSVKFNIPELESIAPVPARIWCDILDPGKARVLAHYTADYYADRAAVTLHSYGKGQAIYVGTFGDRTLFQALFGWLLPQLHIAGKLTISEGLEVNERQSGDRRLIFILNHKSTPQTFSLPDNTINIVNGDMCGGEVTIVPHDVMIFYSQK
jgi:beta-galactosidase